MPSPLALAAQVAVYALVAASLGFLSESPPWPSFPDDRAEIVLSFAHGGARKGGCRDLTADELAGLAPNMRPKGKQVCPRERVPLQVQLVVDGAVRIDRALPPGGLAGDAPSRIYERLPVAIGEHRLVARLRDSERTEGYDYEMDRKVTLDARQRLVLDFRTDHGGFVIVGVAVTP